MKSVCRPEARFWRSLGCRSPVFNAPMAGFTGPEVAPRIEEAGAGMVILGGYPGDREAYEASKRIAARGREEFVVPPEDLPSELSSVDVQVPVLVNVRFTSPEGAEELCPDLADIVDGVEINAHCRQREMVEVGGGEALMNEPEKLCEIIDVVASHVGVVSVKLRGPHPSYEDVVSELSTHGGVDFVHVDAMKPGEPTYDLRYVRLAREAGLRVVGNNSIRTPEDVVAMFDAGASAVSVGRPLLEGRWDLLGELSEFAVGRFWKAGE